MSKIALTGDRHNNRVSAHDYAAYQFSTRRSPWMRHSSLLRQRRVSNYRHLIATRNVRTSASAKNTTRLLSLSTSCLTKRMICQIGQEDAKTPELLWYENAPLYACCKRCENVDLCSQFSQQNFNRITIKKNNHRPTGKTCRYTTLRNIWHFFD